MSRIRFIIQKEFLQIKRDRAMIAIIFIVPLMQLLILGYVVSSDVKNIKTVICDMDQSPLSRELVDRIEHSGYFAIKYFEPDAKRLDGYFERGTASVALLLPRHFSKDIATLQRTQIQIVVDGQDANTANVVLGFLGGILENFARAQVDIRLIDTPAEIMPHSVTMEPRIWYNQELKYSDYMVPGIAAFLLTVVTSLLSAMGLVREREIGTMEQLLVTPIRKHQLLIGKIVPFAILGFFELSVAIAFAKVWYQIPIVGNLGLFALFTIVYLFTTLGLGIFVSATAHTQQQALFMIWFIVVFAFLMSGFVFPIENMPRFAQLLTYLNPLRYFIIVIREIFIKGAQISHLYTQGLAMLLFSTVIFILATIRFQQRIR